VFAEEREGERTVTGMPNSFWVAGIGRFFEDVDEGVEGRGVHGNLLVRWGNGVKTQSVFPYYARNRPIR